VAAKCGITQPRRAAGSDSESFVPCVPHVCANISGTVSQRSGPNADPLLYTARPQCEEGAGGVKRSESGKTRKKRENQYWWVGSLCGHSSLTVSHPKHRIAKSGQ